MIDLYYWPTPNGRKISIMLEECGLDYRTIPVDINNGDQFSPEFLAISPNNRMPAIVDHDCRGAPVSVFESCAILLYLAGKAGKFMPTDAPGHKETLEWLFWQTGNLGPMAGQHSHFRNYAPEGATTTAEPATQTSTAAASECSSGGSGTGSSFWASIRSSTWRVFPGY